MKLSVTTPRGSVVEAEVDEVSAPGVLGEFGVLQGHIPFLSAISPGVLVYRSGEKRSILAVGEGFLQVAPSSQGGQVMVLVDQAMRAAEVNRANAEREVAELDKDLSGWNRELGAEYQALRIKRAWAAARVDAAARGLGN